MKRISLAACALALTLAAHAACAQSIDMDAAHIRFEFPDSFTVVSPQLATVYAPLLAEHGIDAETLSADLAEQGVLARAYDEDFAEYRSVVTLTDDLSASIFDMANVTTEQRRTMKTRAENNQLFETTGLRARDVEWVKENDEYWLYIHYTVTRSDEIIGRGIRYVTIKNGMYVMIDWQTADRRFTNKDIAALRESVHGLTVTERIAEPTHPVELTAEIPSETTNAALQIEGKASPGSFLVAQAPDENGVMQMLSVGEVGSGGSFNLLVELPAEGRYDITLTASHEGMLDTSVYGTVAYSAKTLPVSGIPEDGSVTTVTTDTVKLEGSTLAGVQLQLITPYGLTKKRSGSSGAFTFDLTTEEEGEYNYTLVCDKDGYDQRRIQFTLNRMMTMDQEKAAIRDQSVRISYKNLQRDLDENRGKTMTLYGPVTEISSSGKQTYLRSQFNKDASGKWFNPVVIVTDQEISVKEGDMITAVVTVGGVYVEQDASGKEIIVPQFTLLFLDKVE